MTIIPKTELQCIASESILNQSKGTHNKSQIPFEGFSSFTPSMLLSLICSSSSILCVSMIWREQQYPRSEISDFLNGALESDWDSSVKWVYLKWVGMDFARNPKEIEKRTPTQVEEYKKQCFPKRTPWFEIWKQQKPRSAECYLKRISGFWWKYLKKKKKKPSLSEMGWWSLLNRHQKWENREHPDEEAEEEEIAAVFLQMGFWLLSTPTQK